MGVPLSYKDKFIFRWALGLAVAMVDWKLPPARRPLLCKVSQAPRGPLVLMAHVVPMGQYQLGMLCLVLAITQITCNSKGYCSTSLWKRLLTQVGNEAKRVKPGA